MRDDFMVRGRAGQQGFTLIEAMVAMVILMFGVAAVANLMVVAGSSNSVANHSTAAATVAAQQMEMIKSAPYTALVTSPVGSINVDNGPLGVCGVTAITATNNCNTNPVTQFQGVGRFHVRWEISAPQGPAPGTRFVQVAAESDAPALRRRSRVLLTTYRTP